MESAKNTETRKNRNARNPFVTAGFFPKLIFLWMFPLFYKGFKTGLTEDDIYSHLKSHDSEILGDKLEREWSKEVKKNKKNASLWKAFALVFGMEMMFLGICIFIHELIRISIPLVLSKLLEYFQPNSTMSIKEAYIYASIMSTITLFYLTFIHHTMMHIYHMGVRLRVAAVALIYRKAMRLSKSALAEITIGQMVNFVSNDVARFETCTLNLHHVWIAPIHLLVILFLLYYNVGWPGITGIGLLLCVIPFQVWMAKKTSVYRLRTAIKTDERIHLMNDIISGIQVIKLYTWEKPFAKIVESARRLEMEEIQKNSVIRALTTSFNMCLMRATVFIAILVYLLLGNKINAQYVYLVTLFYELLRRCVSHTFTLGITQYAEAAISVRRIKEFLLYDELESQVPLVSSSTDVNKFKYKTESVKLTEVCLENVCARWIKLDGDDSIKGINFKVTSGELAIVIGKVGCGKSTLLHVILKELPPVTGTVRINGSVSYASQQSWLFIGSVRQNILFGQEYDDVRYDEVVRVCALEQDIKLLPYGDRTIIGERGVSLSGGQRARINLARAIYKEADIYLLDDPLSAVDVHVGKHIFKECIEGYLKDKCVILVTHQLQFLKDCKNIYLLNEGKVEYSGTYENIGHCGKDIKLLEEWKKMKEDARKVITEQRKERKESLSEKGSEEKNNLNDPLIQKETKIDGRVSWAMYKGYLLAAGNPSKILFLILIFILSQALASGVDYFLSLWVNMEEMKEENWIKIENDTAGNNWNIMKYTEFQKFWLDFLIENVCLIIYTVLMISAVILIIGRAIFFFRCCVESSISLHNNMFSRIVRAPMRFFTINPSGRILNRFSKDMNLVDEWLPQAFSDTVQIGLMMIAIIVVVAIVTPIILVPTGVILVIFYLIRQVFLTTSRDIKRFEGITRSPVYSHLTTSLQGLTTIRAFGAQQILRGEFDNYQNTYSSTCFMFIAASRTFGYWLDFLSVVYITLVTFSFLFFNTGSFGGSVGLAITQAINLSGWCQFGVRQWSEMENTMTSIERIKEYADITPEDDSKANDPPVNWPEVGNIQFINVSLRYDQNEPYVLKNLNFHIKSTEKVGIVGRTGAGKSSIIAALFRLAESEGQIVIDSIDSKTVPLNKLRSSISIIPQEPVLFSGTLRKNLDPFDEYSDTVIWDALAEVQLRDTIADLPQGLESKISEGGSNFSVGQRQLICLARASVRKNKILVLDEATANVDPHTNGLIQITIRQKFTNCTVLTIAHRLQTIIDSDKILVMDAGSVAEFGCPFILLQKNGSIFSELVKETGQAMAANLADIAAQSCTNFDFN